MQQEIILNISYIYGDLVTHTWSFLLPILIFASR